MKIVISPAKKMRSQNELFRATSLPQFVAEADHLAGLMREMDDEALKALWQCSDKLLTLNKERLETMDVYAATTPAILAYEGLQYQHLAANVLSREGLEYINEHLRILSGFYGILRPFDAVVPYRLEMQAKWQKEGKKNLYEFWGSRLYEALDAAQGVIINLASNEYAKTISPYISTKGRFVTCRFGEVVNGAFKQKGTFAKMARGEMVRFIAEHQVDTLAGLQDFDALGLEYAPKWSDEKTMSFVVRPAKEA